MTCKICELIRSKLNLVYEDDIVYVYLDPAPAVKGQMIITPKSHFTIMEMVPDDILGHLFTIANRLSLILFQNLSFQGTNILINNGVSAGQMHPHFNVHIIPRMEGDGLNLTWEPKKFSEEEMSNIELKFKEISQAPPPQVQAEPPQNTQPIQNEKVNKEPSTSKPKPVEEDYLLRQIRRIP